LIRGGDAYSAEGVTNIGLMIQISSGYKICRQYCIGFCGTRYDINHIDGYRCWCYPYDYIDDQY